MMLESLIDAFYNSSDPRRNNREFYTVEKFNHHEHLTPLGNGRDQENDSIFDLYLRL